MQVKTEWFRDIPNWSYWLGAFVVLAAVAALEYWAGRVPMCTCGIVKLWEGTVSGPGNSQHIADWYTFSHIIHGFLFYGILHLLFRKIPWQVRLLLALGIEGAWEVLENSPLIIERYRAATISLGYNGDSILNSLSDLLAMVVGFWAARKWPVTLIVALALAAELFTGYIIRDNLTLNIIMLVHPSETIKQWQSAL